MSTKYEVKLVPVTSEEDLAKGHAQIVYLPEGDGTYKPYKITVGSKQ